MFGNGMGRPGRAEVHLVRDQTSIRRWPMMVRIEKSSCFLGFRPEVAIREGRTRGPTGHPYVSPTWMKMERSGFRTSLDCCSISVFADNPGAVPATWTQ